jgi:hypothetical protein
MTAGLSKSTNHKPNPIGIQGIGNPINACKCSTRGRKYIGSIWSRNTWLDSPSAAAQSLLLEGLEYYQSLQHLNNNVRKQAIQRINETIHPNSTKIFYSSLRTREHKNHLNRSYGQKVIEV